jgi:antitoxin component YwqK of YwqJK toxin-antitoxin module
MAKKPAVVEHTVYHKDGSLWAKGQTLDGVQVGYWEWFRKDGTRLRSGFFEDGKQTGKWTTYDCNGKVHKITTIKPKVKA